MTTFVFILIIFHRLQVMDGLGTHHPSLHITQITYTIEKECVVVLSYFLFPCNRDLYIVHHTICTTHCCTQYLHRALDRYSRTRDLASKSSVLHIYTEVHPCQIGMQVYARKERGKRAA
jgi:hypothetical protein